MGISMSWCRATYWIQRCSDSIDDSSSGGICRINRGPCLHDVLI
ncbi:hypothetical protein TELCIR_00796 [Teladorsagia circumcincta]|uniref:Uncharacterized protein n=1 Tax=Teladorsagia circumcincta TaxID=45464 RepID=A0A2G9V3K3_TELCI|nr:hypothetical protein TELCIR_00796 [Teladorsagia circumcincta]